MGSHNQLTGIDSLGHHSNSCSRKYVYQICDRVGCCSLYSDWTRELCCSTATDSMWWSTGSNSVMGTTSVTGSIWTSRESTAATTRSWSWFLQWSSHASWSTYASSWPLSYGSACPTNGRRLGSAAATA